MGLTPWNRLHIVKCLSIEESNMSSNVTVRSELLRSVPLDSWVALSDDESRIVAVGKSYAEVVQKSDDAGETDPVILKTPPMWAPVFV